MVMPSRPSSASRGITSEGNRAASSVSATWGRISVSANRRTVRRISSWSAVSEKSTWTSDGPGGQARRSGREAIVAVVFDEQRWPVEVSSGASPRADLPVRLLGLRDRHAGGGGHLGRRHAVVGAVQAEVQLCQREAEVELLL